MRKVVDGKVYDTDAAEKLLDVWAPTQNTRDIDWHDTSLYRTKKGTFFVAGQGNARSRWGISFAGSAAFGEGLELVTEPEARELVEEHGTVELYARLFGAPEEG